MRIRLPAIFFLLSTLCFAGVVDEVRLALSQGNFTAADAVLQNYRAQHSVTPEYLEGLSWMARASLANDELDRADSYARQTENLSRLQLAKRALDAEPHLPIALGAALEVQSQVLAAHGEKRQAIALLRHSLAIYRNTSIAARLRKNLNLLSLVGSPAPPLSAVQHLGPRPVVLSQVKGSPVLLFFWAHWCVDCKAEGPIISRLRAEFAPRGLIVIAPTQLYGYAARGEDAPPKTELAYIEQVWQRFYPSLQDVPVPVSKANFDTYGASTTPTLVLIDRAGKVALYHPGVLTYEDLRTAIEKSLSS
jgi:thiol-disulfide isomerase/thioredoxin